MLGLIPKIEPFIFPNETESDAIFDKYASYHNTLKLSKKQYKAILAYKQITGFNGPLSAIPYTEINRYAKSIVEGQPAGVPKDTRHYTYDLYSIFPKEAHRIDTEVLYRGDKTIPTYVKNIGIGDTFNVTSFVSMSTHPQSANEFSDDNGAIFIIKNAYGIHMGTGGREHEYLAAPDSLFRVDEVYRQDWVSPTLSNLDVTVFEVTMISKFTPYKYLTQSWRKHFGMGNKGVKF